MDIFDLEDLPNINRETAETEPSFLADLNPEQRQAVLTTEGPLLVLSGAGTGKTKVLTTRIAFLIHQKLARPWQILAVTFTNKASREMKERLETMIGADARSVWLGTFHSIGVKIINKYAPLLGLESNFIVLGTDDQERLLKQILSDAGVDTKKYPPATLLDIIQRWKDKGLPPESVTSAYNTTFCDGRALEFYQTYQRRLKTLNAVDFGDLLLLPLLLFQSHPDILETYQNQFKYILVDEYQDTNIAQYLLLRLLAQKNRNICCVGDDDQSIYSWRGAEVENILSFQTIFKDALLIRLERNYRSTSHILGAASGLISHNAGRLGKTLRVADAQIDSGEKVIVHGFWNGEQEVETIVEEIENAHRLGTPLSHMAILVRAGFQTRAFEEVLMRYGVPYKIIGGFKFYEREEIKDAIAYLRLISNTNDDLAFMRIINKPRRGVGDQAMQSLTNTAKEKHISLYNAIAWSALRPTLRKTLDAFIEQVKNWQQQAQTLEPKILLQQILEESGYLTLWRQEKSVDSETRLENLTELYNVLGEFQNIRDFIEYASLVTDTDEKTDGDQLVVMTLHASKGLEFDHVYLPGWEEGLFPHQKAIDEAGDFGLEEERRLAYVGLTRARKRAFISFAQNRRVYGQWQSAVASRFIDELPPEHIHDETRSEMGRYHMKLSEIEIPRSHSETPLWGKSSFQISGDRPKKDLPIFGSRHRLKQNNLFWSKNSSFNDDDTAEIDPIWDNDFNQNSVLTTSRSPKSRRIGKRVYHENFGYGTVVKEEGNRLDVRFDSVGIKKVLARYLEEVT